jgi:hypothetical protein
MPVSTLQPDPFPPALRFADVDPAELEGEASRPLLPQAAPLPAGAWNGYLARLLPPVRADRPREAGCAAVLRTRAGMADFLVSLGPGPAHAVARGLHLMDRTGFWREVQQELAVLAPGGS